MIRDIRRTDGDILFTLMDREFPEESALLGGRPEAFQRVVRRVFRWDSRFVIGLLRLFGRPIFRYVAVEADRRLVGTTMVTFPRGSAYVSNVVVDPAYRRRGYAKLMLEEARRTARGAGRRYLVLDVLDTNTGARTLYDSLGYRPLRSSSHFVHEELARFEPPPPSDPSLRPFRRTDAPPLVEIVRREHPARVEQVLPVGESRFVHSSFENRLLETEEAAWVVDRGRGPEAHVGASCSAVFAAANLSAPVVGPSVEPALAVVLVRTAGAWCAARKAPRILTFVNDENQRGRAALEGAGFRNAHTSTTLYRPVD